MLDMIRPLNKHAITLKDLKQCKMTPVFFDTFFNLEKYLDHEQRDPFATQRETDEDGNEVIQTKISYLETYIRRFLRFGMATIFVISHSQMSDWFSQMSDWEQIFNFLFLRCRTGTDLQRRNTSFLLQKRELQSRWMTCESLTNYDPCKFFW